MYIVVKVYDGVPCEIGTFHSREAAIGCMRKDFFSDHCDDHGGISEEEAMAGMGDYGEFEDASSLNLEDGAAYLPGRGGTDWCVLRALHRYYFTFGTDHRFPYQGGYVCVQAETRSKAVELFREKYPDRNGRGTVNCAFIYNADEWQKLELSPEEKQWDLIRQEKE